MSKGNNGTGLLKNILAPHIRSSSAQKNRSKHSLKTYKKRPHQPIAIGDSGLILSIPTS